MTELSRARPRIDRARVAIAALFFVNGFGYGVWVAHIPLFKARLGVTDGPLGFALLGAAAASLVTMPLVGAAIGRRGSRGICATAALAACLSLVLPFLAPTYLAFVFACIAIGTAYSAFDVAMNAQAVAREKGGDGAPLMSSFHAAFSFGGLAGSLGSSFAIARGSSLATDGIGVAALCVAVALATLPYLLAERGSPGGVARRFPPRVVAALGAIAFFGLVGEGAVADWSGIYLRESLAAAAATSAAGFGAFSVAMALGRLFGDRIVARFGSRRVLVLGATLAASALALALVARTQPAAFVAFVLVGLGLSNVVPIVFSLAGDIPGLGPGVAIAAVSTFGYVGFLVGPPTIGLSADAFGLPASLGLVVASIAAIVVVTPLALRRKKIREAPHVTGRFRR